MRRPLSGLNLTLPAASSCYHQRVVHFSRALVFRVVAGAVGVNALAGIAALLTGSGNLGETETRILLTALTLSFASILLLAPVAAWQRIRIEGVPALPLASALCTAAAAAIIVGAIWTEPTDDDYLLRSVFTLGVLGIGLGHLSLLLLARPGLLRLAAAAVTALLCAELIAAIWGTGIEGDDKWRLIGITTILAIALSVLVPVRQWSSGLSPQAASKSVRFCPYCGQRGVFEDEAGVCSRCGRGFEVRATA